MKYKYRKKNIIKKHILLRYFSIMAGNDNKKIEQELNKLMSKFKI